MSYLHRIKNNPNGVDIDINAGLNVTGTTLLQILSAATVHITGTTTLLGNIITDVEQTNTFLGISAGYSNTTGTNNTFIGYQAGYLSSTGCHKVAIGYQALYNDVSPQCYYVSDANVAIGAKAGYNNTSGYGNLFLGGEAGSNAVSAVENVFIGRGAGFPVVSGNYNISIGTGSGGPTTGSSNIVIGNLAGNAIGAANNNIYIGYRCGQNNTGGSNAFVGDTAGMSTAGGWGNAYFGIYAGYQNANGIQNTYLGSYAGGGNGTSSYNAIIGYNAGLSNAGGNYNVFVGHSAGYSNVTGGYCVFLGYQAGYNETTSNKLYIANSNTTAPLIYGEFDNNILKINGSLIVTGNTTVQAFTATTMAYKGQELDARFVNSSGDTISGVLNVVGNTNITGDTAIVGNLVASTKSFLIPHPTKEGKKLHYGSLEGPEHGIYFRGELNGNCIIELPEYWTELALKNSITVNLTPFDKPQSLWVKKIENNKIYIGHKFWNRKIKCYFTVFATRQNINVEE